MPYIKYRLEMVNIILLLTFVIIKNSIFKFINIVQKLTKQLELLDKIIKDKIILFERNLIIVQNCQCAIYWRQKKTLLLNRFYWLKPIVSFFHL